MDLQKLINEQMEIYISEKLPEQTAKHLEKMVDGILEDLFSRYGDSSKQVKETISKKISLNLEDLQLIDYNGMISTAIQNHFNHLAQEKSIDPIMKLLKEVVGEKYEKDQITLDDLFEEIKELTIEGLEHGDSGEVSFYAKYNKKYDWVECFADNDSSTDERHCGVRFIFSGVKATKEKGGGTIFSLTFPSYSGNNSTMDIARLNGVEKLIHKIWTSGTRISIPDYMEDGEIDFDRDFEVDFTDR